MYMLYRYMEPYQNKIETGAGVSGRTIMRRLILERVLSGLQDGLA